MFHDPITFFKSVSRQISLQGRNRPPFILNLFPYKNKKNCDQSFKIFDGRRRYDLKVKSLGVKPY